MRMASGHRATLAATRSAANPNAAAGTNSAIRTAITTGVAFDIRTILIRAEQPPGKCVVPRQRRRPLKPRVAILFRRMQSDPKESHNTSSLKWMEPNWPTCPALEDLPNLLRSAPAGGNSLQRRTAPALLLFRQRGEAAAGLLAIWIVRRMMFSLHGREVAFGVTASLVQRAASD